MRSNFWIGLGITLGVVALLVGIAIGWSWWQERKKAKRLRERGPKATIEIPPQRRNRETDRWNMS
jgi:uncharacterized protein YneF (UPF0154 family)